MGNGSDKFLSIVDRLVRLPPVAAGADAQRVLVGALDFPTRSWWRLRLRAIYDLSTILYFPIRWEFETDDGSMPLTFPVSGYINVPAVNVYNSSHDRSIDLNCSSVRVYIRRLPRVGVPGWPAAGSSILCNVRAYPISIPSRYGVINEQSSFVLPAAAIALPTMLPNMFDGPLGPFLHPWSDMVYMDWSPDTIGANPVAAQIDLWGYGESLAAALPSGANALPVRLPSDPPGPTVLTQFAGEHVRWPIPPGRFSALRFTVANCPGMNDTGLLTFYESYKVS